MACLVRQLFRIKIGKDVDPALIDDIMFPLLLTQRTQPKQLLQDIKLTRGPSEYVDMNGRHKEKSLIILDHEDGDDGRFTSNMGQHLLIVVHHGKRTSAVRIRDTPPREWGAIDIVNKMRSLKRPQSYPTNPLGDYRCIYMNEYCPHDYDEDTDLPVADIFIEKTLREGKRLSWSSKDYAYDVTLQIVD